MMNTFDKTSISAINRYFKCNSGKISTLRYNCSTLHVIVKSFALLKNISFLLSDKVNFRYHQILNKDFGKTVRLYKISDSQTIFKRTKLNVPNMFWCQNCATIYRTRYQYQKHQCDFSACKAVVNVDFLDLNHCKAIKYDCSTCGKQLVSKKSLERHQTGHKNAKFNTCEHCKKQFASENRLRIHKKNHCKYNLERHQTSSHENAKVNTCEHCKKQFVSKNRLRIHKEKYCKKAEEISKFYRGDLTVWMCKKCNEVFSSRSTAAYHVDVCTELVDSSIIEKEALGAKENFEIKTIEKISTKILLQCEFCNRIYANKHILLKHQKTHNTNKNYECVICKEYFDSYVVASQHWEKKCSDKINLFCLPKLTYCEFCNRTFKSHEILYTHKIKKQHYIPKIHESVTLNLNQNKDIKNKDTMDKLIEDVLIGFKVPISKDRKIESTDKKKKMQPSCTEEITEIKTLNQFDLKNKISKQNKRERKRKYPQQQPRIKKPCVPLNKEFKYQCERCIKVWNNITELEAHRKMEHTANFNCDKCGQVLDSVKALLVHSRAHKSLKPYVCETCGRSYSQTLHLWQHMQFHQGIKPFACSYEGCEARYAIRSDLEDHIRKVHTRERPFRCNVCGKYFLTGSVYYQHRLIHTEDRRYACDVDGRKAIFQSRCFK